MVSLKVSWDYDSDCGYCSCSCECLSPKATNSSVKFANSPRVKTDKAVKLKATGSKKDTTSTLPKLPSIRKQISHSVEDLHRNVHPETIELCESMQNLCMSPRVFRAYNSISTHDQKILNRMADKRSQRQIRAENAWLAEKMWQNERYERELMKYEQQEAYRKALKEKQELDSRMTQLRFDELLKQDRSRMDSLKKCIQTKDILSEQRLEKLRYQRDAKIAQRHNEEVRKFENIIRANDASLLNDEIRKQNINHHLEQRLDKADSTRRHYLAAYKRRLQADNYRERALHRENYDEAMRFEKYKHEQLQDTIAKKDEKVTKFVERRRRIYGDSMQKARLSSSLRELVRRSISPDSFQVYSDRMLYDRPISNLSILSSIKLG